MSAWVESNVFVVEIVDHGLVGPSTFPDVEFELVFIFCPAVAISKIFQTCTWKHSGSSS